MLPDIPVAFAAVSLFGSAPLPADTVAARGAVDFSRPATPLHRTSSLLPRLAVASLDLVLRLFLYWEMILILATLTRGHPKAGDKTVEVTKVRITDEGHGGLEES